MTPFLRAATVCLAIAMSWGAPQTASAQNYPTRPVRIIATTPAGGPQDLICRVLANYLSKTLGQPFIVENRVGGNTIIGAQAAYDAPADGYTLLMGADATFSINPHLHSRLPYDPNGFVPIALLIAIEQQLYVRAQFPANSLAEFIAYAKARPGQLNYASVGVGSTTHLATERLMQATGINMVHVPFRGSGDALPALLGDQVQTAILALTGALPLLQSKQVKALATGGSKHFSELPGVPTFAEAGYPQLDFKIWYGLMAKRGTPQPIVDLLSKESLKYITSDEFENVTAVRNRWTVTPKGPAEFAEFLKKDREIYGEAVQEAKLPKLD